MISQQSMSESGSEQLDLLALQINEARLVNRIRQLEAARAADEQLIRSLSRVVSDLSRRGNLYA
jgi:hypothetical protein